MPSAGHRMPARPMFLPSEIEPQETLQTCRDCARRRQIQSPKHSSHSRHPRPPLPRPGYVFTGEPLQLAAGHFGLGHGSGAHAPDEYYVIESRSPKMQGMDGAVRSFVEYLYEIAATR